MEEAQFNRNSETDSIDEENSDNADSTQGRIRLSLFKTENGTSMFPKAGAGASVRADYISNTLQPISSEAGDTTSHIMG